MSESNNPSKVFVFDNDDPQMQRAYQCARETFRYFWREIAWERRRIVPALDLACVKAPFSDGEETKSEDDGPEVEHMWINEVDFDGQSVTGVLVNTPNLLKTVKAGDSARVSLETISDWMYAIEGKVYGAFSVNLMRYRMEATERREHDKAWGLDFGEPETTQLIPTYKQSQSGESSESLENQEHPMSEAMGPSLVKILEKDPSMLSETDGNGWTLLHHQALAGSAVSVKILLEKGANPKAITTHGMTPLDLARSLGWGKVVAILEGFQAT